MVPYKKLKNLSYQERSNLLNNNPVLVARHFQYKPEVFFKEIILDGLSGKSKYHAIRIEFQERWECGESGWKCGELGVGMWGIRVGMWGICWESGWECRELRVGIRGIKKGAVHMFIRLYGFSMHQIFKTKLPILSLLRKQ